MAVRKVVTENSQPVQHCGARRTEPQCGEEAAEIYE